MVSAEEFDQKREALDAAQAQVTQALENVYQARAALGLPGKPPEGTSLTDVPADLDQTFSSVRQALADLLHSAAQLGVVPSSYDLTPKQTLEEFYKRDPGGDINRIYAEVIKNAPGLKQAEAALLRAQRDLDQAKLDLRYCTIVAEIDGVVTRRNVNPGNNVQVGQSLMAIRSLRDIWVDANFKETQLRDLRIGQRVELEVDMYGGKRTFEGRISGFTMGTGSTLALLPAQNATGNFVKVVQRLPVRIDVLNYDPDKVPLFVGLSVTPSVDFKSRPDGPERRQISPGTDPTCRGRQPRANQTMSAGSPAIPALVATSSPRVFNPWLIAFAVVVPTFMEVLDTTIANVALRYIAGGLSSAVTDSEWVDNQLSRRQCHHPADLRLARRASREAQLFPALHRGLYHQLRALWHGDESESADPFSRHARSRRRRSPALQPGHPARYLSAREAGRCANPLRRRRPHRSGARPDARRLAHRPIFLALDLFHQSSCRCACLLILRRDGARPRISS